MNKITITEAEELVKTLNLKYSKEAYDDYFKFTIVLTENPYRCIMITYPYAGLKESEIKDCVFSYFYNKEVQISNIADFRQLIKVIPILKDL